MIVRQHPCDDAKVYKSIAQAAEDNGIAYHKMYNAINKHGEFVQYPHKFTKQ